MNKIQSNASASYPLRDGPIHRSLASCMVVAGVCILLAAMVWIVFGQTLEFGFVNYDDNVYVYENPEVARGISLRGVAWAFTHIQTRHWAPLTTISHMLDCRFFGLQPRGHHLTNVLLHASAAVLLFFLLRRMMGATWRSAFVAAVLETLAAAFAESGDFPQGVETAQRALGLANSKSNVALAATLRSQIALYQAGKPFRDGNIGD